METNEKSAYNIHEAHLTFRVNKMLKLYTFKVLYNFYNINGYLVKTD